MFTANELPHRLKSIKHAAGIPMVKFEEAKVDLGMFTFYIKSMNYMYFDLGVVLNVQL